MNIKKIASHFGVSTTAVSRAVNNSGYIRKDLPQYAGEHHWQNHQGLTHLSEGKMLCGIEKAVARFGARFNRSQDIISDRYRDYSQATKLLFGLEKIFSSYM